MKPLTIAIALLAASTPLLGQYRILEVEGNSIGDDFGYSIAGPIDLDGDGYHDLLASGYIDDSNLPPWISLRFHSGKNGGEIRKGIRSGDHFASALDIAGDVNGDGKMDYIVGGEITENYVWVYLHDGRLWQQPGNPDTSSGNGFGYSVSGAGDVDKDGFDDVIVGSAGKGSVPPYAVVFSGKTGKILHKINGPFNTQMGSSVADAGDANGDGYADVMIGSWIGGKSVRVYSGRSGSVLYIINTTKTGFGRKMKSIGDVDKDGTRDLLIADSKDVHVHSGKTGKLIRSHAGARGMDCVGDLDGDGHADYAVGEPRFGFDPRTQLALGRVQVISGKAGAAIAAFSGRLGEWIGARVAFGGDLNGDKQPDLLVSGSSLKGKVIAFSLSPLMLYSDRHAIPVATGGNQVLNIFTRGPGPASGADTYWILGSATDIKPGVKIGPVTIPLVPDAYTDFTILFANGTILQNTRGKLGKLGPTKTARATIAIPANLPVVQGLTLFHSALLLSGTTGLLHATNAVPLRLY